MRKVGDAIEEFEMIKNGDRVIVGLSGGKDSMTLLHALLQYRHIARHTLYVHLIRIFIKKYTEA